MGSTTAESSLRLKSLGRAASSDSRSDGNATLTQAEVDAEVHLVPSSDDQQEMAHPGRRLLESVAAEVARQTKSRALAVAVPRSEIRQTRLGACTLALSDRVDAESQVKSVALLGATKCSSPAGLK